MSELTTTDYVAWIGAITGSAALLFDIWKYARAGARIRLSVSQHMSVKNLRAPQARLEDVTLVTVTNLGDANTTVTHVYIDQANTRLGKYGNRWFGLKWRAAIIGPNPPALDFPAVISPGERWVGQLPDNNVDAECDGWKYNYLCVVTSTSKRATRERIYAPKRKTPQE